MVRNTKKYINSRGAAGAAQLFFLFIIHNPNLHGRNFEKIYRNLNLRAAAGAAQIFFLFFIHFPIVRGPNRAYKSASARHKEKYFSLLQSTTFSELFKAQDGKKSFYFHIFFTLISHNCLFQSMNHMHTNIFFIFCIYIYFYIYFYICK